MNSRCGNARGGALTTGRNVHSLTPARKRGVAIPASFTIPAPGVPICEKEAAEEEMLANSRTEFSNVGFIRRAIVRSLAKTGGVANVAFVFSPTLHSNCASCLEHHTHTIPAKTSLIIVLGSLMMALPCDFP